MTGLHFWLSGAAHVQEGGYLRGRTFRGTPAASVSRPKAVWLRAESGGLGRGRSFSDGQRQAGYGSTFVEPESAKSVEFITSGRLRVHHRLDRLYHATAVRQESRAPCHALNTSSGRVLHLVGRLQGVLDEVMHEAAERDFRHGSGRPTLPRPEGLDDFAVPALRVKAVVEFVGLRRGVAFGSPPARPRDDAASTFAH